MANASSRLVGRGSIYTLATAAPMLAGVAVTPALSRSLDVLEYGRVSLALSVMQFAVGLLTFGLPLVITRQSLVGDTGAPGARGLALSGAAVSTAVSVVAAACLFVYAALSAATLTGSGPLALALVAGGAGAAVAMAQAIAVAGQRAWSYVSLAFGVSLLAPAVGLGLVVLGESSATLFFIGVTGTYLLVALAAAVAIWRSGPRVFSRSQSSAAARMGLPLLPHQLALGSGTGAAVVVAHFTLGTAAAGHAQIAVYLGSIPLILVSALSYAWLPIILSTPPEHRGSQLADTAATVTWLAALGASGLAMLAPWLLRFLAPPRFDIPSMVPVTAFVALASVFAAVFTANMQLAIASGRTAMFAWATPASLGLGALVGAGIARAEGLVGVGVGYLVTYVCLSAIGRVVASRHSDVVWSMRALLLPAVTGVALCLTGAALPVDGLASLVRPALAILIGAAGAWFLVSAVRGMRGSGVETAAPSASNA